MDISDSTVTADKLAKGVTAYDKAGEKITGTMEASSAPILQEKTVTPSTATQSITADNGYDGLSKVTVNGDANLTADNIKSGTSIFGVTGSYAGSSPNLQSKSVTYTSNGTATVTPDEGYDGLSSVDVTVNVASGGSSSVGSMTDMYLSNISTPLTLNDIIVESCFFRNGEYEFTNSCSNVTFKYCLFFNSLVKCTQEIHDAIVNGENNDYSSAYFDIIS